MKAVNLSEILGLMERTDLIVHDRYIEQLREVFVLEELISTGANTALLYRSRRLDKPSHHVMLCPVDFVRLIRLRVRITFVGASKIGRMHFSVAGIR